MFSTPPKAFILWILDLYCIQSTLIHPDDTGQTKLAVTPQWWYFVAITLPLTIIIFLIWMVWQRWERGYKFEIILQSLLGRFFTARGPPPKTTLLSLNGNMSHVENSMCDTERTRTLEPQSQGQVQSQAQRPMTTANAHARAHGAALGLYHGRYSDRTGQVRDSPFAYQF